MDYNKIATEASRIAKLAGKFMLGAAGETQQTDKTNRKDFVTVADIKSQNIIVDELNKVFPGVTVLSEEHPEAARAAMYEDDFTGFVIDPIDGTYNFKRDMRESAISIGYIEHGTPKAGVVYDPYKDELYSAVVGQGAFRNDKPISVSTQADLEAASISTSNSYDDAAMARNIRRHLAIYEQTGVMPWTNCPGSGVLILSYVACGRFDIYHHNGLKPWDNAAAFLIIREAGGVVHTLDGHEASFTSATVLAGPQKLVELLEKTFAKVDPQLLT
ncbi:MAG TPA: inositol monophosphatase family protein [Candidatus Saccharimonadales bacterium]|nr:inositol monophosphatase family protein [Candidatus Saccharimonadales bacterium]